MALELSLKLNNQTVTDYTSDIRIINEFPTLNWEFDLTDRTSIDIDTGIASSAGEFGQSGYQVRVADSTDYIGTDAFVGNMAQTGSLTGQKSFWRYSGTALVRGITYYGQIYVVDENSRQSVWTTFSFTYNSLPIISNVSITPIRPSTTDDLQLNYDFFGGSLSPSASSDIESGTKIRWFKNGVHQKQLNDTIVIESFHLQNNDIWNADIYPSDGYEYASRVTASHVMISKTAVTVSDINVLPKNPNSDDILKADYLTSNELEQENVLIRWYVNNLLVSEFNDQQYIKPAVEEEDEVRFEIKHVDSGLYVSSPLVIIVASDFIINNIIVDGKSNSLNVSSTYPLVQWNIFVPDGREVNYISIKIGTFYESDNIYSTVLSYNSNFFTIPPNLLNKGQDYYISIAASDIQTFVKYTSSHFRINGSRWEKSVSNSNGWTFEMFFSILSTETTETDYQVIRINDGTKFAEIRLYTNKIVLISGSRIEYNNANQFKDSELIVAGKNDDIKIYLNRNIVIDGEGVFTQESNIKRLEIGSSSSDTFSVYYKYLFYTTSGYFLPGSSGEYSNIQFHTYMEFEDNEVVALNNYTNGRYVFGLNPDNTTESSSIYAIVPGESSINYTTVPRAFSPINKIGKSPDDKVVVYAHAKGATVIRGYIINPFNHELIFVDSNDVVNTTLPTSNGWELVRNIDFNAAYFDDNGFNINTSSSVDPSAASGFNADVMGGVWYYTQDKFGSEWFNKVDNRKGWTLDFNLRVSDVYNSELLVNDSNKGKGAGIS